MKVVEAKANDKNSIKKVEPDEFSSESLWEQVLNSVSTPIFLINEEGVILYTNLAFSKIVGIPNQELNNEPNILDFFVASDHHKLSQTFMSLVNEGENDTAECEVRLLKENGEEIMVEAVINTLNSKTFVGTIFDKSVSGKLATEAKKTDDLENLFFLISHNLKSPIVSIQGFTNLLLENRDAMELQEVEYYAKRIQKNASRMNMMVQDILEFSKLSKKEHTIQQVDLKKILENIKNEFTFQLKKGEIELRISHNLPLVMTDKEGINTVFLNLLDNAIKYIGNKKDRKIEVGWEDKGRFHVFFVEDNGVGISKKNLGKVMDLFDRGEMTDKIEGTGLGLAIVKRIVEQLGGLVKLNSELDKGTSVYFTLPKRKKHKF